MTPILSQGYGDYLNQKGYADYMAWWLRYIGHDDFFKREFVREFE